MTHYIIQVGHFFGSFFFIYVFHLVIDLEIMTLWCLGWTFNSFSSSGTGFVFFFIHLILHLLLSVQIFDRLCLCLQFLIAPFCQCSTISLTGLSDSVLSSSPSQMTSDAGYSRGTKPKNFFSSKKIHERLPPSCFLSSLEWSTVSWLSHDLLLRMSLTLAKESGISAFCHGLP